MSTIQSIKRTAEDPRATTYTSCSNQEPELEKKIGSLFSSLLPSFVMRREPTNRSFSVVKDFISAVNDYRKSRDKIKAAKCYIRAAGVYEENGDSRLAAEYYRLAAGVYEENGDSRLAAEYYRLAADVYLESGNKEEAAHCYEQAEDVNKSNGNIKEAPSSVTLKQRVLT